MRTIKEYRTNTIYNRLFHSTIYSKAVLFYLIRTEFNYLFLRHKNIDLREPNEVKKRIKKIMSEPNFERFIIP
jgi:hypothetical protein